VIIGNGQWAEHRERKPALGRLRWDGHRASL